MDVASLVNTSSPLTFVALDGTWDEARRLFDRNPALRALKRAALGPDPDNRKSAYVVRTQPADFCLSTVESVARTLALAEGRPDVEERLVAPLHAMCNFQVNHGAVGHDSKEFKAQNSQFVKRNNFKKKSKKLVKVE